MSGLYCTIRQKNANLFSGTRVTLLSYISFHLFQIFSAWGVSALVWPPWIIAWPYIEGKRTVPESECEIQACHHYTG